jgi:exosortase D (VPLPA-CTERM-specific)
MRNVLEEIRIGPDGWMKAAGYAGAILMVYYSALTWLVFHDWGREDYSHCSLIPLVVLYLIWEKKDRLNTLASVPSWTGLVPFLLGIGFFWLGELGGEYFMLYFSLWLVLIGLCWLHLGWQKIKSIGFALVVMLAMFPFPNFINVRVSLFLQLVSSRLGVWMLHVYGMSAYREGNVIDLGFTQLQVVEACSGLRYVMPMMILSSILAYWFRAALWKKAVLFLSSIPLAIFLNSFRIAATGILYSMFGPSVAEGFFHGFSGWLLFVVAIPLLVLIMWGVKWLPPMENAGYQEINDTQRQEMQNTAIPDAAKTKGNRVFQPVFLAAMAVLALTFGLSHGVEFRNKVPASRALSEFPMQVGAWTGTHETMAQIYLDSLYFSDYLLTNYVNAVGRAINFYVAYYQDQRKGESVHSPETCLPGGGWDFKQAGEVHIPLNGNSAITVKRAFMEKDGSRQLTYFWFAKMGRVLTTLYQLKLYTFWDSLTLQRTDAALVRIITPVYPDETLEAADARLQGFTQEAVVTLKEFIPD